MSHPAFGPIVSVDWLLAHIGDPDLKIVDCRPSAEYSAGHLPGAVSIDMYALRLPDSGEPALDRFIAQAVAELRRCGTRSGDRVVCYEGFSGTNAARGVWLLDLLGLGGGAMLDGGMQAWHAAGGAFTVDPPTVDPSTLDVAPNRSVLAGAESLVGPDAPRILDTRADIEFRAGTIPQSVHLEWLRHLTPDGRFLPMDELRALYGERGFDSTDSTPIATFCGSGYRAAHTYVVLKALGFANVRNYAPSWGEWSRRSDLPVERPRP